MARFLVLVFLLVSTGALAQTQEPKPTPEELAFARLPADLQQMLAGMTPAQAMQAVAQAGQQSIALGRPRPSHEELRGTLRSVLEPSGYVGAGAGGSSFPPLSPLVPPPPPPFLR